MNTLGQRDQLLINLLSASTLLHETLTNNLVNQNTPGYRRQTVAFEKLLAKELAEAHPALEAVAPRILEDEITPSRPDGNNVSMDREARLLAENALRFNIASNLVRSQIRMVRTAVKEGS